jgi:hypothetical protein
MASSSRTPSEDDELAVGERRGPHPTERAPRRRSARIVVERGEIAAPAEPPPGAASMKSSSSYSPGVNAAAVVIVACVPCIVPSVMLSGIASWTKPLKTSPFGMKRNSTALPSRYPTGTR